MDKIQLKDVKNGEFFKLKDTDTSAVYIKNRGDYDKSEKAFYCCQYEDYNHATKIKPSRLVYIGFTY